MGMAWTVRVSGGPRRVNHAGVLIGNSVYSFGGYCAEEADLMEDLTHKIPIDVTVLDTKTYRWTRLPMPGCHQEQFYQSPYMRYGHTVVAYQGKAYLWGGRSDSMGSCNMLYMYDPTTHRFEIVQPDQDESAIPGSRDGHSAAVYKDDMIICGGYVDNDQSYGRDVHAFNFTTRRWRQLHTTGEAPSDRDFHSATIVGTRMYVFGGRSDEFSPVPFSHEFYCDRLKCLDLETLEWTEVEPSGPVRPCGRRSHSAWEYQGSLYLFGGYNGTLNTHFKDLHRFHPETKRWEELKPNGRWPCPRRRQVVVQVAHRVFIFGGTTPKPRNWEEDMEVPEPDDPVLVDLDDVNVLDLQPTLYELAIREVVKNNFSTQPLPREIRSGRKRVEKMGEARLVERELVEHGLVPGRGLGDGSYGRVVRARRAEDGRGVAVKVLDHRKMTPRFLNQFLPRELLIHSGLRHRHVVRLFEHWQGAPGPHTYIVLELAENGDLEQHISRKGRMVDTGRADDLPRSIFHQVLLAVQYLHNRGIAHRDIKCENVLLTASLVAKLGDFGFARHQARGELSRTFCGSRAYAAPEVARQYPYSGQAADWWSLGVVLFIMLEARLPFDDRNVRAMIRAQTEQRVPFSQCPIGQPRFLILALLDPKANTRLSVTAALRHPWLLLSSIPDDLTQIPNDPEDDDDSDIP